MCSRFHHCVVVRERECSKLLRLFVLVARGWQYKYVYFHDSRLPHECPARNDDGSGVLGVLRGRATQQDKLWIHLTKSLLSLPLLCTLLHCLTLLGCVYLYIYFALFWGCTGYIPARWRNALSAARSQSKFLSAAATDARARPSLLRACTFPMLITIERGENAREKVLRSSSTRPPCANINYNYSGRFALDSRRTGSILESNKQTL